MRPHPGPASTGTGGGPPAWGIGNDLAMHLAIVAILVVGAASAVVWTGAQLAAAVSGHATLDVGLGDAATALVQLRRNGTDPASAWPPHVQRSLPGPVLYWLCTAVVAVAGIGVYVGGWWLWSTRWRGRSNALGVEPPWDPWRLSTFE